MNNIFCSLVGTYCFYNDSQLTLKCDETNLSSITGYSIDEIANTFKSQMLFMIHPEDRLFFTQSLNEHLMTDDCMDITCRIQRKDGTHSLTLNKIRHIVTDNNADLFYGVMMDVSKSKENHPPHDKSLEQYQLILSKTDNVTFEIDLDTDTVSFSENWNKLFGFTPNPHHFLATLPANSHIHPADIPQLLQNMRDMKSKTAYCSMDLRIRTGCQFLWFCMRAVAVRDEHGKLRKIVGILLNIDNEKKETLALHKKAEYDSLTQLLNRETANQHTIEYLNSYPNGAHCALMIIDLDNFKQINDSYGHMFGDKVLIKAAEAIKKSFRDRDLVARIGGDEFMVLMKGITNPEIIKKRCTQILTAFHSLLSDEQIVYNFSCSIGVALSPEHAVNYSQLFEFADEAMYQVKKHGKNNYSIYQPANIR